MNLRRLFAVVLLLASAFGAGIAQAQVDPSLFQDLRWRLIGPFRGGRVLTAAGVPGEPEHFYFGSVNGGVWETRDAGRTWQPIFDGQPIGSIGALAVAPSDPRVIYVGSGEADMRSDIAQGNGMYRSADGGKTWTRIGLADSQQIGRVLIDPRNPDVVYVAALGHPYGLNAERGVFRSRDGGKSWQKVLGKGDDTGAIDLAFEPGKPEVIYASLWQARRTPWTAAAFTSRSTVASTGRSSARACPRSRVASALPWRRASRSAYTPWWTRPRGASSARTTVAPPGRWRAAILASGGAAGISAASPSSPAIPTSSTPATRRFSARRMAARHLCR